MSCSVKEVNCFSLNRRTTSQPTILIVGADLPPPYGGLAKSILNNSRFWTVQGSKVVVFLSYRKEIVETNGIEIDVRNATNENTIRVSLGSTVLHAIRFFFRNPVACILTMIRIFFFLLSGSFGKTWALFSFQYISELLRVIEECQIDLIETHYAFEQSYFAITAARLKKIPVVLTTYSESIFWGDANQDTSEKYLPLFEYVFRNVDAIIAPSEYCLTGARRYIRHGQPHFAIFSGVRVPAKIDQRTRSSCRKELACEASKVILFVGQLHSRKGPVYPLRALPYISEKVHDVKLVYVGPDFGIGTDLEKEAKKLDIQSLVQFAGPVSDKRLMNFYCAADVLVFPSVSKRECMGMSMKEAMAFGVPVVAFDVGGVSEAVIHGHTGFVVPACDVKALAEALVFVLTNDKIRIEMGEHARDMCLKKFSYEITAGKKLHLYKDILEEIKR